MEVLSVSFDVSSDSHISKSIVSRLFVSGVASAEPKRSTSSPIPLIYCLDLLPCLYLTYFYSWFGNGCYQN
jgi:hypothetical protein